MKIGITACGIFCIYTSSVLALCNSTYDIKGNLTEETCKDEWGTWGSKYDENGRLIEEYSFSGDETSSYSSGSKYTYDDTGKKTSSTYYEKETGTDPYEYEEKTTYEYNTAGQLIKENYDDGEGYTSTTNYEYDDHGNVTKQETLYSDGSSYTTEKSYEYYDNGNLKTVSQTPYGVIEEYNENGLKIKEYSRVNCYGCDGPDVFSQFAQLDKTFEYDDEGRLIKINEIAQAGCSSWASYCFDYVECYSEYEYDENGNLSKEIIASTGGSCTYWSNGQYYCNKGYTENTYEDGKITGTYKGRTHISNTDPQSYTSRDLMYTYGYDQYGNMVAKYDASGELLSSYYFENPTYNTVMRIYTVDEANMATTENNNTVFIRYK